MSGKPTEGSRQRSLGVRLHPRFQHALTLDDRNLDKQLDGLIQDIKAGLYPQARVHRAEPQSLAAAFEATAARVVISVERVA